VDEPLFLSFVMGEASASELAFFHAKGLVAALLARFGLAAEGVSYAPVNDLALLAPGRTAEIVVALPGQAACRVGLVGEVAPDMLDRFSLPGPVAAAELRLDLLEAFIARDRALVRHGDFPAVARDINLVLDESVPWANVEAAIRGAAGDLLERVTVGDVWRDSDRLGAGRKSVVVSLSLRSRTGTLTGDEAAAVVSSIVDACGTTCGATLRA
jgi:phenylalanyl-tRNA synthetase beta chain